jgi:hypothetical protein
MVKRGRRNAKISARREWGYRAALALGAALSLAGCMADPEPKMAPPLPLVETFGSGDSMVYIGDTARFTLRLAPKIADVEYYRWRIVHGQTYDTLDTREPALALAWDADQTGWYSIHVGIKTRSRYRIEPFSFDVRVDSGAPELELDPAEEFPFGAGNRCKAAARDPNGTIAKYYWSTRQDVFTDSTDGPEWILPDNLLGYERVYCKATDNSGFSTGTVWTGVRILPKTYGTIRDDFHGVAALPDGGLLAVGYTGSFDTRKGEPWIARLDADGDLAAKTTVKRSADFGTYGQGAFLSLSPAGPASGFVAAGVYRDSTHDDGLLVGIDAQGNVAWKTFIAVDSGHQSFAANLQADAGRHIAVGYSVPDIRSQDTTLALFAVVDPAGGILLTKTFRHRGGRLSFHSIAPTRDGNVMVAASGTGLAFGQAGYLYKLNLAGDSLWARPIEQFGLKAIAPQALVACRSGGFALLLNGYGQSQLVRLDEEGQVVWSRILLTVKDEWTRGGTLLESASGDFLLGCDLPYQAQPSGIQLIKVGAKGDILWSRNLGSYSDGVFGLAELPSGGFAAAGETAAGSTGGSATSAWVFRFDDAGRMMF